MVYFEINLAEGWIKFQKNKHQNKNLTKRKKGEKTRTLVLQSISPLKNTDTNSL